VVANAVLLAAASFWLLIPDASVLQLIFTGVAGLAIVLAFAWLHCGTLAHEVNPVRENLGRDFRVCLKNIPIFIVLFGVLLLLMRSADGLSQNAWRISGYFFTRVPAFLQRSIGEYGMYNLVQYKIAFVVWFLLPAIFLPLLSVASSSGWHLREYRSALRVYKRWAYWLVMAILAILGVWLPLQLIRWTPGTGLKVEFASIISRLAVAYILMLLVWIMATGLVGWFRQGSLQRENAGGQAAS
jgi:hypothetical protein